jgi:hypothetical protein
MWGISVSNFPVVAITTNKVSLFGGLIVPSTIWRPFLVAVSSAHMTASFSQSSAIA